MQLSKLFFLILIMSIIGTHSAFAKNPFAPVLTINENPELCAAFEAAWGDAFESSKQITDGAVNLTEVFPAANHLSPKGKVLNAGYYNHSHIEFDYDGDGDEEVLYFESENPRSVYGGTAIYYYQSRDDFESEPAKHPSLGRFQSWSKFAKSNPSYDTNGKARILALYRKLEVAHIFQKEGKLYSQSNIQRNIGLPRHKKQPPQKVRLDWLRPTHAPEPVCELDFNPAVDLSMPSIRVLGPLVTIYGGREGCYGTMGFTALPIHAHYQAIYRRPQTMGGGPSPAEDTAREFRFIAWGLSDPSSFEVIRDLKAGYPVFIDDFTTYYQAAFGMDERTAKLTAEKAYRYLLDKVYYGRSSGPQMHRSVYEGFNVGPSLSLKEIASVAINKAAEFEAVDQYAVNLSALRLGIMAGVEADKLKPLLEAFNRTLAQVNDEDVKKAMLNGFFLASLTYQEMREHFLDLGADVDYPTNYFNKTALMYAAQNNDLNAVVSLLKNGANPNSQTLLDPNKRCVAPLKRDARTPLMYAAENADATLILTLLESGAERRAKDTQGNMPVWYLERNTLLSDNQKTNLTKRFLPK